MASNILTDAELAKIRERVSVAFVTGEPSVCNPPQYHGPSQGEYIRVLDSHAALAKQAAEMRALLVDLHNWFYFADYPNPWKRLETLLAATAARQTKED